MNFEKGPPSHTQETRVGKRGPESDIILFKKQQKKFDKEQRFQGDKGYQGAVVV